MKACSSSKMYYPSMTVPRVNRPNALNETMQDTPTAHNKKTLNKNIQTLKSTKIKRKLPKIETPNSKKTLVGAGARSAPASWMPF